MQSEKKRNKTLAVVLSLVICICFSGWVSAQEVIPQPGTTIDKTNFIEYKEFFPDFFHEAFSSGWELVEPIKITVQETTHNPVPEPFMAATERNKGKYSVDAEGYIQGGDYKDIVGFPFPDLDPVDGEFAIKFMWNFDYRYKLDDMYAMFMNYEKRKGESTVVSTVESFQLSFQNRMYLDPKPLYETTNGLRAVNFLRNVSPPVQRNFMTLLIRYIDQKAPDATFLYLPSMRRTLRGEAGERSTPIQSSTQAPDDFEGGFNGRIPEFTYKYLGEKKIIGLADSKLGYKEMLDVKADMIPVESRGWEVKDVYIFEITPKDPKYPMSRKVIYIDKESHWPYYCAGWDRAGALWKVWQTAITKQPNAKGDAFPYFKGMLGVDIQLGYGVQMFTDWEANAKGLTEADVSVTAMRQKAR